MPTNEIKPSLKEKLYQETLDEIAQAFTGYNPEGDNATIFNWSGFIQEGNLYVCGAQDRIENAVKLAIDKTDTAARAAEREKTRHQSWNDGFKEGQKATAKKIFGQLDKFIVGIAYTNLKDDQDYKSLKMKWLK